MTAKEVAFWNLDLAAKRARRHAKHCRSCYHPIIDDEGNPGYFGEACKAGFVILKLYTEAESAVMDAMEDVNDANRIQLLLS